MLMFAQVVPKGEAPTESVALKQTLVLGAHGPYRVHIVVIREP